MTSRSLMTSNFARSETPRPKHSLGFLVLVCAVAMLSPGCNLKQPHAEQHAFTLEAARTQPPQSRLIPAQVQVKLATIAPPFDSKAFTYRTSDLGYKSDYYNGFVTAPNALLTAQLQSWCEAARLFQSVVPAGSTLPVTHTLETRVFTLHGDFRNPSAPQAVVEARFQLLDQRPSTPALAFDKTYREAVSFNSPQPDNLTRAWSQALTKIFAALESDLATSAIP